MLYIFGLGGSERLDIDFILQKSLKNCPGNEPGIPTESPTAKIQIFIEKNIPFSCFSKVLAFYSKFTF